MSRILNRLRVAFVAVVVLTVLLACSQDEGRVNCDPQDGLTVVCGFQSPEDFARLPDGSGVLVSEFGMEEDSSGQISLLDLATGERRVLYSAELSNDMRMPNPIWGDPTCQEPVAFSPHGIDLYPRGSRYQLLVVNHASRESIEMFELSFREGEWDLQWRLCRG